MRDILLKFFTFLHILQVFRVPVLVFFFFISLWLNSHFYTESLAYSQEFKPIARLKHLYIFYEIFRFLSTLLLNEYIYLVSILLFHHLCYQHDF